MYFSQSIPSRASKRNPFILRVLGYTVRSCVGLSVGNKNFYYVVFIYILNCSAQKAERVCKYAVLPAASVVEGLEQTGFLIVHIFFYGEVYRLRNFFVLRGFCTFSERGADFCHILHGKREESVYRSFYGSGFGYKRAAHCGRPLIKIPITSFVFVISVKVFYVTFGFLLCDKRVRNLFKHAEAFRRESDVVRIKDIFVHLHKIYRGERRNRKILSGGITKREQDRPCANPLI